ncbi:MAG: hypothetical protein AAF901_03650 [Bacteroidota bacterium]
MQQNTIRRNIVLGILFFLPVGFLLMLYPSKNNYTPLAIVNEGVVELSSFDAKDEEKFVLEGNITVLGFLGEHPNSKALPVLNLKEMIYDKFLGFKKFQVLMLVPHGTEDEVKLLKKELDQYEPLKYWHFVYGNTDTIQKVFNSLKSERPLNDDLSTNDVFIVDAERNQRGRLDDRSKNEIEADKPVYPLYGYDCIKVSELKNKMAKEDIRVLFLEYREKRKGKFDSSSRRANDLKDINE